MRTINHPSDPGTGNKMWNKRCEHYAKPGIHSTTDGKSIDGNATNASPIGRAMESPTAKTRVK